LDYRSNLQKGKDFEDESGWMRLKNCRIQWIQQTEILHLNVLLVLTHYWQWNGVESTICIFSYFGYW
jgi:hypothetical protein